MRARIVEAAEGNPLFVEQLVSMMVDDGLLRREGRCLGSRRAISAALRMPPTIQALLAARLDRLTDEERAVIERGVAWSAQASPQGAVDELVADGAPTASRTCSQALVGKQLVRPEPSSSSREAGYPVSTTS